MFATDACATKTRQKRARAKHPSDAIPTLEVLYCSICDGPLLRGPLERRKLYHDECKFEARKLRRVLRGR
jgi:hypothetical protein